MKNVYHRKNKKQGIGNINKKKMKDIQCQLRSLKFQRKLKQAIIY